MSAIARNQRASVGALDRGAAVVDVAWSACAVSLDLFVFLLDARPRLVSMKHLLFTNNSRSPDGSTVVRAEDNLRQTQVHFAGTEERVRSLRFVLGANTPNTVLESLTGIQVTVWDPRTGSEDVTFSIESGGTNKCVILGDLTRSADGWAYHAAWDHYSGGIKELADRLAP